MLEAPVDVSRPQTYIGRDMITVACAMSFSPIRTWEVGHGPASLSVHVPLPLKNVGLTGT